MSEKITIDQNNKNASNVTQIGVQNNTGLTAEDATHIATALFRENFPILVEEAKKIVNERVDLFMKKMMERFESSGKINFDEFKDPDVQGALLDAQTGFARFGDENKLDLLVGLIAERVEENSDFKRKVIIDEAIRITAKLSKDALDYMAIIFLSKMIFIGSVKDYSSFCETYTYFSRLFPISETADDLFPFVNTLGCFQMQLGRADESLAKTYSFLALDEIKRVLPSQFNRVPADYALSPPAVVIVINYINSKTKMDIDYKKWL